MNLAVDQGNTKTKAALFKGRELVKLFADIEDERLTGLINEISPDNCVIATVRSKEPVRREVIKPSVNLIHLTTETPVPIKNKYQSPSTLGMDRLASVIGSKYFKPGTPNLVIDCGTCITYDVVDAENQYLGGGISPGLSMRFKALNTFTAALPLIEIEENVALIGDTTKGSILSGVANGTVAEVAGIIAQYRSLFPNLEVFLCGGDAHYFDRKLRGAIFVAPELVLYGLNEILLYNVKNI